MLKLLRSNSDNELQFANIDVILVTLSVWKTAVFITSNLLQLANKYPIFVTSDVSKLFVIFNSSKE